MPPIALPANFRPLTKPASCVATDEMDLAVDPSTELVN
jgi:hypothetical protein